MTGPSITTTASALKSVCSPILLLSDDGLTRQNSDYVLATPLPFTAAPRTTRFTRSWQCGRHKGAWSRSPVLCHKMFVPGFGEKSPERKAADSLHHFFTFLAVKIVLAQLEDYNTEAYEELMEFVDRTSLNDGDKFCAELMRESSRHKGLALRILEVRSAYAREDFEWENLKALSLKQLDEANTAMMRQFVVETSNFE